MHCAVEQWLTGDIALSPACLLLFLLIHPRNIPTILLYLFLSVTYNLTFTFTVILSLSLSLCPTVLNYTMSSSMYSRTATKIQEEEEKNRKRAEAKIDNFFIPRDPENWEELARKAPCHNIWNLDPHMMAIRV